MKAWMVRWLRQLLAWLDPEPPPAPPDRLTLAADALVHQAALLEGVSGEYRRHWVYTRLVKQFPDRRRRDLGMAIERAVSALA